MSKPFLYRYRPESKENVEEEKGKEEVKEEEIVSNWDEKVDTFDELKLKEDLLRGIYGYGFTKPSPIQQKGILPLLAKRDTIAQVRSCSTIGTIWNRKDGHFCYCRSSNDRYSGG